MMKPDWVKAIDEAIEAKQRIYAMTTPDRDRFDKSVEKAMIDIRLYIRHLLERLRYGKSAIAMRTEAAELIEWLVSENVASGLKLDTARMAVDALKKREARWIANFRKDANTLADIADRLWTELDRVEPENG